MSRRWIRLMALTAVLLCVASCALCEQTAVPALQIETEQLEAFEDEPVPLAGGSATSQVPLALLWSLPIAGVTVLGLCAMVLLQDRRQLKELQDKVAQSRQAKE